jgi:hypothetical protein
VDTHIAEIASESRFHEGARVVIERRSPASAKRRARFVARVRRTAVLVHGTLEHTFIVLAARRTTLAQSMLTASAFALENSLHRLRRNLHVRLICPV